MSPDETRQLKQIEDWLTALQYETPREQFADRAAELLPECLQAVSDLLASRREPSRESVGRSSILESDRHVGCQDECATIVSGRWFCNCPRPRRGIEC